MPTVEGSRLVDYRSLRLPAGALLFRAVQRLTQLIYAPQRHLRRAQRELGVRCLVEMTKRSYSRRIGAAELKVLRVLYQQNERDELASTIRAGADTPAPSLTAAVDGFVEYVGLAERAECGDETAAYLLSIRPEPSIPSEQLYQFASSPAARERAATRTARVYDFTPQPLPRPKLLASGRPSSTIYQAARRLERDGLIARADARRPADETGKRNGGPSQREWMLTLDGAFLCHVFQDDIRNSSVTELTGIDWEYLDYGHQLVVGLIRERLGTERLPTMAEVIAVQLRVADYLNYDSEPETG